MKVHFIGAGPGASDLLTLRAMRLIQRSPVCLYAGSLIPKEILAYAPSDAHIVDTARMTLDEIIDECSAAYRQNFDVARLHSGDLSIWSAMAEQLRRLDALGIAFDITPGVPAFAAAAAALQQELTLPGVAQTLILTRTATRSTPMPVGEELGSLAKTGALLAIHLSVANAQHVVRELEPFYGTQCPVAVVFRASWPDEIVERGTLGNLVALLSGSEILRTAIIFVGPSLDDSHGRESFLYSANRERNT